MRTALMLSILAIAVVPAAHAGNVALGVPFELAIGEFVAVGDQPLLVALEDVPADSRCPLNVVCVWEGEVTARVGLEIPGEAAATHSLHSTGSPFGPSEVEFDDYLVKLNEVRPYPTHPVPIDSSDYRVSFVVVAFDQSAPVEPSRWSVLKGFYR